MVDKDRLDVESLIKEFLDSPNLDPDGCSWPKISGEELSQLFKIVFKIALLKWGKDVDGDIPVSFAIVNRSKGYLRHTVVPHTDDLKNAAEYYRACRDLNISIQTLSNDLKILLDCQYRNIIDE